MSPDIVCLDWAGAWKHGGAGQFDFRLGDQALPQSFDSRHFSDENMQAVGVFAGQCYFPIEFGDLSGFRGVASRPAVRAFHCVVAGGRHSSILSDCCRCAPRRR